MAFKWGSKTKKWQIEVKSTWHHIGGKINWFEGEKKRALKESLWFEEPRCKLGLNSRIQFASNESKLVPMNLDLGPQSKLDLRILCFKKVLHLVSFLFFLYFGLRFYFTLLCSLFPDSSWVLKYLKNRFKVFVEVANIMIKFSHCCPACDTNPICCWLIWS